MENRQSYKIGDIAISCDIDTSPGSVADSSRAVSLMKVGDQAFIRRSDKLWHFATVSEVSLGTATSCGPFTVFIVCEDGSTKKVGSHHWGSHVRPHKPQTAAKEAPRFPKDKDLRASCPVGSSPFDIDSTNEKSDQRFQTDSNVTESSRGEDKSTVLSDLPVRRKKSLKDMLMRKISGKKMNNLANKSPNAPEDTRNQEFNLTNSGEPPMVTKSRTSMADTKSSRRLNRKGQRATSDLATSSLFKNLMMFPTPHCGEELPKRGRRSTTDSTRRSSDGVLQALKRPADRSQQSSFRDNLSSFNSESTVHVGVPPKKQNGALYRRKQRRNSLKSKVANFAKRLSGEPIDATKTNFLASVTTTSPNCTKIHACDECSDDIEGAPVTVPFLVNSNEHQIATEPTTTYRSLKGLNREAQSATNDMTTTSLFLNVMGGSTPANRCSTATGDSIDAISKMAIQSAKYKPKSSRRANIAAGHPSQSIMKDTRRSSERMKGCLNENNKPRASIVTRDAFTNLLKEMIARRGESCPPNIVQE